MLSRRGFLGGAAALVLSGGPAAFARTDYWGEAIADAPADFIFGYGSLINTPSREATGGGRVDAVPARLGPKFNLVRSWVARSSSGFTALGLRPRQPDEEVSTINGVVFPVDAESLPRFDRRESGYDRVVVPRDMIEPLSWRGLPAMGTIWTYVPRGSAAAALLPFPTAEFPIVQSYVDLVMEGALEYGPAFARELIATTADWGRFWLNDRVTARRPWIATPKAGDIDRLLGRTPPAMQAFADRLTSEAYVARHLRALQGETAR